MEDFDAITIRRLYDKSAAGYHKMLSEQMQRVRRVIEINAKSRKCYCVYHVPPHITGYELYDQRQMTEIVTAQLMKKGFMVKIIDENVILIYFPTNETPNFKEVGKKVRNEAQQLKEKVSDLTIRLQKKYG